MNLTDLRDELTTHADDLGPATDLRPGVASRVRRTRRRRAAATGTAATLAVAALAVGVLTSVGRPSQTTPATTPSGTSTTAPMIGADGMPFRTVPDAPGDIVKDGLRYRARVADDTLAVGAIGDRGQGQFTLRWTPTTTHVSVGAECYLPGLTQAEAAAYMVTVTLQGTPGYFGSSCSAGRPTTRDLPAGGSVPGDPGRGWSGLVVGRDAAVRIRIVDAKTNAPASVDGAQLTGAVYELGPEQAIKDDAGRTVAALPETIEHQGYRYRITSSTTVPLTAWQDLTQGAPASPAMVTWGSAGENLVTKPGDPEPAGLRISGLPGGAEGRDYGSWGTSPIPEGSTPRFTVSATGARPDHGSGFVAVYRLATDQN